MSFALHPQLAKDCAVIGNLKLCRVLLMNNIHFPWLILVPMRENMRELFDLAGEDYAQAMEEIRHVSKIFAAITQAHKMNIAALGNMVPQLHIHVIARFPEDAAWPNPVWNAGIAAQPYGDATLAKMCKKIQKILN